MARARFALLAALSSLVPFAACTSLIGFQPLSGIDAGADAVGTDSAPPPVEAGVDTASPDMGCVITWVDASGGALPPDGAVGNEPIPTTYACRVQWPGLGTIPGKLLPGYQCYFGDGTSEQESTDYQVLVTANCAVAWQSSDQGKLPNGAFVTGDDFDAGGVPPALYTCRVSDSGPDPFELGHEGWSTSHQCVYSLSGMSLTTSDFELLTAQ